ncbi:uncharacterized protein V1510DRAFT_423967 [Dipodascopsis tothii]|uniref:uncharacterized protein n=1 Tax=Dipodascopsis tothii TaxID=44089 RepID=UPI0034CDD1A0
MAMGLLKQLKYKYYVTLPLYMLTRGERIVLNAFFFLLLAMLFTGVYTYFPNHLKVVAHRTYYYYAGGDAGDESDALLGIL